jgi:hypothetical protein
VVSIADIARKRKVGGASTSQRKLQHLYAMVEEAKLNR